MGKRLQPTAHAAEYGDGRDLPKLRAAEQSEHLSDSDIYWENPAASGDSFVFADPAGNTLFTGRCEAANQSQYFAVPDGVRWNDWQLTTLASGTIYLYFKT